MLFTFWYAALDPSYQIQGLAEQEQGQVGYLSNKNRRYRDATNQVQRTDQGMGTSDCKEAHHHSGLEVAVVTLSPSFDSLKHSTVRRMQSTA